MEGKSTTTTACPALFNIIAQYGAIIPGALYEKGRRRLLLAATSDNYGPS